MASRWIVLSALLLFSITKVLASQDPTAPLGWNSPKGSSATKVVSAPRVPTLQSIVCKEAMVCYAILDDKLANVNDMINGFRVQAITQNEVIVTRGKASYSLALFISDIKK